MKIKVTSKSKVSRGIVKRVQHRVLFDNLGARLTYKRVVRFL